MTGALRRVRCPEEVVWVADRERVVVVRPGRALVLEGLDAVIWELTAAGQDPVATLAALDEGGAAGPEDAVQRCLRCLVEAGMLELVADAGEGR